jgi:hypothetical protein
MGTSLSRLSAYLTPQHLFLLLGSYLTYSLLRRYLAAARANSRLQEVRKGKQAQREADARQAVEKLSETEEERRDGKKEEEITSASAATLVKKMSNGQCNRRPRRVPMR